MRIFVGCSEERIALGKELATALETAKFEVVRWWDDDAFPGGTNALPRLIELSNDCDGAALVFGNEDEVQEAGARLPQKAPRDNVVLEYGIFVSKLGQQRTLILAERNTKIPSNLDGVVHCSAHYKLHKLVESLERLRGLPRDSGLSSHVQIQASRKLIDATKTGIPARWGSRSLYIDYPGAEAWRAVEEDMFYDATKSRKAVVEAINRLARGKTITEFGCAVSFGPGIGLLDKRVLIGFVGRNLQEYVPIDINTHLAIAAADRLDLAKSSLHVPLCITADFEEDSTVITQLIHGCTRPKRLFIMLGGTFGNLETGEDAFLTCLHDCMKKSDVAILDVSIAHTGYTVDKDPYSQLDDKKKVPDSVRRFLASGVERRLGVKVDEVMKDVLAHIRFCIDGPEGDVDGTFAFEYRCTTGDHPLMYVKRYDFQKLSEHLGGEDRLFTIIASESVGAPTDLRHRGIYFLKKR